jgi:hypothetical protein
MLARLPSLLRRFFPSPKLGELEKDAAGRAVLVGLTAEESCIVASILSRYKAGHPCAGEDVDRLQRLINKHADAVIARHGAVMAKAAERMAIQPVAVRATQAAAMLGICESKLRAMVAEGRIRPPVRIDGMQLFDVETLRDDWQALRDAAMAETGPNPWDEVLAK